MVVALACILLAGFVVLAAANVYIRTVGQSSELQARRPEPSMKGPRDAIPATAPGGWILSQDYPDMALQGDIEGATEFRVRVSTFGEVMSCEITVTSGYPELDSRVCNAVSTRARFYPALDAEDKPTEGTYSTKVVWRLTD